MNFTKLFFYLFMPIFAFALFFLFALAEMTSTNEDLADMPYWRQNLLLHVLQVEAKFGYLKAEAKLGRLNLPDNDVEKRKYWLQHSAEKNFGYAQLNLGANYLYGLDGYNQDANQAVFWLEKAANNNVNVASEILAKLYTGDEFPTFPKNPQKVKYWGAKSGLGDPTVGSILNSLSWALGDIGVKNKYIEAANQGNKAAQFQLGNDEIHKNHVPNGIDWLIKSANQGNDKAAYQLAQSYNTGNDVPADKTKACYWFQKAADLGHAWALSDLGICYSRGEGVAKNPQKAFELYQLGAAKGDFAAMYNLGLDYSRLDNDQDRPVPLNYELAFSWYEKSNNAKTNECATNDLGFLYAAGKGVEKNQRKAKDLFSKALNIMLDNHTIYFGDDLERLSRFSEAFAEYQYALASNENPDTSMQKFDPEMVAAVKKASKQLVDLCWK